MLQADLKNVYSRNQHGISTVLYFNSDVEQESEKIFYVEKPSTKCIPF